MTPLEEQVEKLCDDDWMVVLKKLPSGIPFVAYEKQIWQDKWVCELSCFRRVVGSGRHRPGVVGMGENPLEAAHACVRQLVERMVV